MIFILELKDLSLPYDITLSMTNDCNFACPYCYVQKAKTYMTFEVGKKAIDYCYNNLIAIREKYKEVGTKIAYGEKSYELCSTVSFFGGEPLLNFKVLKQIVEYAETTYPKCWYFNITTNGTLLTDEICEFLSKYNFHICLSWDGVKEDQDKQRPYKDHKQSSYDAILKAVDMLLRHKPYLGLEIRSTVTKDTIKNFYKSYKLFESFEFDTFSFDLEYFTPWDEETLLPLKDELEKVYRDRALCYFRNESPKIDFALSFIILKDYLKGQLELLLGIPVYIKTIPTVYTNCGYGLEDVVINGKGDFYPCHEEPDFMNPEFSNLIGNIDTGIDLQQLEKLRENIKQVEQKFLDTRECYKNCILKQYHMNCAYTSCPSNLFQTQKVTTYNCIVRKWCLELLLKYSEQLYNANNQTFKAVLELYPTYNVYQDILAQPEGMIRNLYIEKYKKDFSWEEL